MVRPALRQQHILHTLGVHGRGGVPDGLEQPCHLVVIHTLPDEQSAAPAPVQEIHHLVVSDDLLRLFVLGRLGTGISCKPYGIPGADGLALAAVEAGAAGLDGLPFLHRKIVPDADADALAAACASVVVDDEMGAHEDNIPMGGLKVIGLPINP